jgi:ATP-binding cassette subfamily B protein
VLGGLAGLHEDQLFLSNLYEFLDLKQKVAEPSHPVPVPRPMREGIVFEGVSFTYPGGTRKIIEEITLAVRPGEMVALVGENGSGKTTLIKLLCRLYDPTGGRITLDGIDLRDFGTTALRREISVIFQDYARYHLTARENIRFGDIALPPDDQRISAAAGHAGAEELIAGLPRGYDTPLGRWFEDGEEISAGEWQKLALARAFIRDSQLLVLDEPTSALDAGAEHALFRRSRWRAAGRAVIVISHRFSTVRVADRIYVLRGGRIAEHGSHTELIRAGGLYARMFEMQAGPYLA